ncbi:MAG: LamG domain-containing protein, partial [Patescibacteria group bacterium]
MNTSKQVQHGIFAALGLVVLGGFFIAQRAGTYVLRQDVAEARIALISQTASLANADASNLVAHYRFDDGSGTTAADASATSNSASLGGGVSFVTNSPKIGTGAVQFSGSGHITIPSSSSYNFGTGDFTVAFWVKTPGLPPNENNNNVEGYFALGGVSGITMYVKAGELREYVGGTQLIDYADVTDDGWHHVVLTRSSGTVTGYIDSAAHPLGTAAGDVSSAGTVILLGSTYDGSYPAIGRMDDVRVYNRALTSGEVSELYNLGGGDLTPPTVSVPALMVR